MTQSDIKTLNRQTRAAAIVSALVIIGCVIYGIRSKKKWWYYLLVLLVIVPASSALTIAATGPMITGKEELPAEEEPTKEA